MASKCRAIMVFKKCTFMPSKQAHALNPLEQIVCPPFFGPIIKVGSKTYLGKKRGKFCAWTCTSALISIKLANLAGKRHKFSPPLTPLTPNPNFYAEVLHLWL